MKVKGKIARVVALAANAPPMLIPTIVANPALTASTPIPPTRSCMVFSSLKMKSNVSTPIPTTDRKSTRLNSSHSQISYAVFCLKKKKKKYLQYNVDQEQST